jgi:hypothetical protein
MKMTDHRSHYQFSSLDLFVGPDTSVSIHTQAFLKPHQGFGGHVISELGSLEGKSVIEHSYGSASSPVSSTGDLPMSITAGILP